MAQSWIALFDEEKNKLVSKVTGEKNGGFIHDALFNGVNNNLPQNQPNEPVRETILKLDEQKIKPIPQEENVSKSKINDQNISKSKIVDSDINGQNISKSKLFDSKINDQNGSKSKILEPSKMYN